jgi:hypothetical protein
MTDTIGHGSVVSYAYLWHREHQRGEESGRKARPACVMLVARSGGQETALFFPITSQRPREQTLAIEIPEIEAKRAQLYPPAWVIVEEFNIDDMEHSFAIEDRKPRGTFSRKFMATLAGAVARAMRDGAARTVTR